MHALVHVQVPPSTCLSLYNLHQLILAVSLAGQFLMPIFSHLDVAALEVAPPTANESRLTDTDIAQAASTHCSKTTVATGELSCS
jgi:hypothetical protein